jgi:phosphonate transport system substrate-binding protein
MAHLRKNSATQWLAALSLAMLGSVSLAWGESKTVYTLAVQPRFNPVETSHDWNPFLTRMEKDSGLSFQLRQYANQEAFEADVIKGIPDFVYLNPYLMVMAKRSQHYLPILRDQEKLYGLILVSRDSPARKIDDLMGKTIAFPPTTLFAPSVYMRYLLAEKEQIRFRPIFTNKTQNTLRTVLAGEADAASTSNLALQREPADLKDRFKILYTTTDLVNFAIAANPRVPVMARQQFQHKALALKQVPEGQKLLTAIQMPNLIASDYARDYQSLEKLHLERYSAATP